MAYTTRADSNSVGPGSMGGGSSQSSGGGLSGGNSGGGSNSSNSSNSSGFQGGQTAAYNLSMNGVNAPSNNGLGLTVNKVMPGNAAFGPAGGRAVGYATVSPGSSNSSVKNNTGSSSYANPGAGNGVGQNNYTTFRNPDGSAMFGNGPGAPGGAGVNARSGLAAMQAAQKLSTPYRSTGGVGYKKPSPPAHVQKRTISKAKKLKAPYDDTLAKFKPWWKDPVTTGPIPVRPQVKPGPNQWGGKANGPLGSGWNDRVTGSKGNGPLGQGAYDRVPQMAKGGVVPGKSKPRSK